VALALGAQREVGPLVEKLAAHVGDDNWREVSLLAIGYMGIVQQRDEAAGVALWDLIQAAPGEPGQAAVLAGEAVVDAWPGGVSPACKEQVVGTLLETMIDDTRVNPRLRAASGRALAQLGDPRPEVMTVEGMQFCYVPHGPFWMGEGDDEHRNECLDYGYWVARHPVTVAQYQPFMEEGGYREQRYWTKAGWLWREKRGLLKPHHRDEPWSLANHPMVDVSWYEAVAYCQWLSAWMGQNGLLPEGRAVRLPSEAEWEKAARGGEEIPVRPVIWMVGAHGRTPLQATPLRGNPHPRRAFPWGEEPDLNLANYDETGINTTSAVGCFPGGSSPYGVKDLSGNVWEWCATKWRESCENSADESLEGDALRVLRGGSFFDNLRFVCCANCRGYGPSGRNWSFGFRVVVAPVPSGL
jgi:formylglycine-generating enzyme required for sulfatase activity